MADISPILAAFGLVRYQTLCFPLTLQSASDTVTNLSLVTTSGFDALPARGPLYTFLTGMYASANAAEVSFRTLGGRIEVRCTAGLVAADAILFGWAAAGPSVPSLLITGASGPPFNQVLEVRIIVPHRIAQ